jgi:CDP-2,3-bis-(O-geranylgeranyl)-sn-glycerol synthase
MPARRKLTEAEKKHAKIAIGLTFFLIFLILIDLLVVSLVYGIFDWIAILIFSLLFIVPAYLSNAGMVIVGGGKPIDGGKSFKSGQRILGDHKTWNGFIKGPLYIGIPISIAIFCLFLILWPFIELIPLTATQQGAYKLYTEIFYYQYYFIGGTLPFGFIALIIRIVLCSYGAAIGDLIGSFIKRRLNYESGAPFWVVDQLDFAIFAIFFTSIPAIFLPTEFMVPDVNVFIFLMILTPSVSIIANTIAYMIGLKDVPW